MEKWYDYTIYLNSESLGSFDTFEEAYDWAKNIKEEGSELIVAMRTWLTDADGEDDQIDEDDLGAWVVEDGEEE